jgi:uncharacterized protein YgbK (DUF1537 family)
MPLRIGAIADDLTGATDLASAFTLRGLRTLIAVGAEATDMAGFDAVVVALKSRSIAAPDAVAESLAALQALEQAGAKRLFFKYCSTFDSTPDGNIGPVSEALMGAANQAMMVHCPAFPETGRSVIGGELFVNGVPLAETSMRQHPINPMTDSNLIRLLSAQANGRVGSVPLNLVRQGPSAMTKRLNQLLRTGVRHAIVDAVNHDDLAVAARAGAHLKISAGATGLGEAIASLDPLDSFRPDLELPDSPTAVLAGSCSETTLRQLRTVSASATIYQIEPERFPAQQEMLEDALGWAGEQLERGLPVVIASSTAAAGDAPNARSVGAQIEALLGAIAKGLHRLGIRRFVIAGGESSGAVMKALRIKSLIVGPRIDPGVPVVLSPPPDPVALILKSGNFGRDDLLIDPFGRALWRS